MRREDAIAGRGRVISLESFCATADEIFDPDDVESCWAMREALVGLAANQEWVFGALALSLERRLSSSWAREQPSYFVLHVADRFAIRANVWLPERRHGTSQVFENAAFSYNYPHDHNFPILTSTCFGPGYETDVYVYDGMPADAGIGSEIDVVPLGRHRLSPGSVVLYEECRDVHTQLPVDDVTVTLNFLPFRRRDHARPQFIYAPLGPSKMRVIGVPLSPEGREMSAARMLWKLHGDRTHGASGLDEVIDGSPNPRVANYAAVLRDALSLAADARRRRLIDEIDAHNVAFKYHEVASMVRGSA